MQLSVKEIIDIFCRMKQHGCIVFGAGKNGRLAIKMLKSVEIEIKSVFDSAAGRKIGGRRAEPLEHMHSYDPETVCIVTPSRNVDDVTEILRGYFTLVVDMQIFDWMMYMVPDKENTIFTKNGILHPFNYYDSPYLSKSEWAYYEDTIDRWQEVENIDLNAGKQKSLLHDLRGYYLDFQDNVRGQGMNLRYTDDNDMFSMADAALLHGMMRKYKPRHIIEIGSGYSTLTMLDTAEYFMEDACTIMCVEPYPDRLRSGLRDGDEKHITLHENFVQTVPLEVFQQLGEGDILFIDSSHVAKVGGDVLWEYFHIVPCLKPGVFIHIHDMFYPFTYPFRWLQEGRVYNEAFIVQAMLMDSSRYEILLYNDMMIKKYREEYLKNWKCSYTPYGGSLWLQKHE